METFAILLLLGALGASQQASPITPTAGGKQVTCQTREEQAEKFIQEGGLLGYVMREAPAGELLAGTWGAIQARDWGDSSAIKKMEAVAGKPLEKMEAADMKKLGEEFGYLVAVPTLQARAAMTLYTEAAWPPPMSGIGLGAQAGARGLVARYSLVGDHAGQVRIMRCTAPRGANIQPAHVARVVGPGEEVPAWLQRVMKTDPRVAQIDFQENAKKLSRLVAPAE